VVFTYAAGMPSREAMPTGLFPKPARTSGNYRLYGPEHVARLSFIRRSRDLGFTIEEVRALLRLADQQDRNCADVDRVARTHLSDVERPAPACWCYRGAPRLEGAD
jgi:DNA-binding transcriptional MerR regulator